MSKYTKSERAEALAKLRQLLKPGQRVYCILRHVSRSGMFRVIDLAIADSDGGVSNIGWLAARAMDDGYDADRGGIKVSGCGMDMGFHLVYGLGRAVWPNGTLEPHGLRNGSPDTDGGYALRRVWL